MGVHYTVGCKSCGVICDEDVNRGYELLVNLASNWQTISKASGLLQNLGFYRTVDLLPLIAYQLRIPVEVLEFIEAHRDHELQIVSEIPGSPPFDIIQGHAVAEYQEF